MTSFEKVYNLNQTIMTDGRLSKLADNDFYQILFNYLMFSISLFESWCLQELTFTEFSQNEYEFVSEADQTQFVLSPAPPANSNFYVSVNGVKTSSAVYDEESHTITLASAPSVGTSVYVSAYVVGAFVNNLTNQEKIILAEGMTVPFQEGQLFKSKNMSIALNSQHSQANHNKVLDDILTHRYKRLNQLISDYTVGNSSKSGWGGAANV